MKTTPLPSVEEVVSHLPMFPNAEILMEDQLIDYDKYKVGEIATLLTQDRNQAYTSLVERIKKKEVEDGEALYSDDPDKKMSQGYTDGYNQALTDILENVVKPLYGKG